MAQPANDLIDMSKIQFYSYAFHCLFAAAKGCLLPFLAIYLRTLGLTASQIGIILGVAAWVTMFSATCWTSCATSCNKRRLLLISATFTLILSYLALMFIPPINDNIALQFCNKTTQFTPESHGAIALINTTTDKGLLSNFSSTFEPPAADARTTTTSTTTTETTTTTTAATTTTTTTTAATTTTTTAAATTSKPTDHRNHVSKEKSDNEVIAEADTSLSKDEPVAESKREPESDVLASLNEKDLAILQSVGLDEDKLKNLSAEDIKAVIDGIIANLDQLESNDKPKKQSHKTIKNPHHRHNRDTEGSPSGGNSEKTQEQSDNAEHPTETHADEKVTEDVDSSSTVLNNMWLKINQLQEELKQLRNQVFAVVMVIMIFAALFGSPVEKMSDDIWFDFLDSSDMLEKYGQHKSWASLGLVIFPIVTTGIVFHAPCLIFGAFLKTKIHFMMFISLMLCCLLLTFVYPIHSGDARKVQRKTRLSRGFRILFSDCHSVMYTLTIIIVGMLEGLLFNFLFWHVQDMNGSELVMGSAITVSALSQIIMYVFHKWLIRKLSYAGATILGLLLLAARLLLYSFVWIPWLVLIGEVFHGLSYTLIWSAIITYPGFRLNPFVMDRSALSVVTALYTGFGLASGSIISGYMIDMFSLRRVFQGGCILAVTWAILFACSMKCVTKKPKVRYAKLLQDDNSDSEDDSESFDENDWLEIALKHQK